MKKFLACSILVIMCMGAASVWGAGQADPAVSAAQGQTGKAMAATPGPDGAQLSNYIMKDNPYTNWKLWPGTKKLYKGMEPHGALLTVYVNQIALDSMKGKTFAEGSIIVKENYTADAKLVGLTTMYKVKGSNPEGGDWFYLNSTPDGQVGGAGKVEGCMKCHAKAADKDYVFSKRPR